MSASTTARVLLALAAASASLAATTPATAQRVGRRSTNLVVTPVNQVVSPIGIQVDLPGLRPQALALSPDGTLLAVSGKTSELVLLDPATGAIRQRVALPSERQHEPQPAVASANILEPDTKGQVSFTGLVFSPDGRRIYLSNVNGSIKVFQVAPDGQVSASHSIPLPAADAPRRREEIPAGLALSADGASLYVCGNLSNRLLELELATGQVRQSFEVGVAPYDVVLVGRKAYVSNWGGRRPVAGDLTGPAGRGTVVRVDPVRHIASEGSVTVLDLGPTAPAPRRSGPNGDTRQRPVEIRTGLHASALALSLDRRYVVCANAASDTLSVIDTRTDRVIETVWVKQSPADLFGASPNALAFDRTGRTLYVANGTQNAVAVIAFRPRRSELLGLIPVGWFPGALAFDARRAQLCVANVKGIGDVKRQDEAKGIEGFNSHQYFGSLSLLRVPARRQLPDLSAIVYDNYRRAQIAHAQLPPRREQPPRPVPERIGEPSVFKHVVYVIKENRTYDQVPGDLPVGNGDPRLCIFGEDVTPNQHKLAREFVLLDNTYCSGILSDGHQWSTTAFATDYMEKAFAGFPRSYPDGMGEDENDALAYSPAGFIWDNVLAHGKSIWNFGEFAMPACGWKDPRRKGEPTWTDYWQEYLEGRGDVVIGSQPSIESIRPFTPTNTIGWEMAVPDVWRARYITNQIAAWDRAGTFPDLVLICLPNDHTSGTRRGSPTPAACVADNDLAFGQIVQALSHSRFWPELVLFAIEDDPQAGWDHVSGYRTTAYCVSPYTRRNAVVSTQYNTTSVLRTIEQILGLPPMNQFDATATPLFDCFTQQPDFTPFTAVPNRVPLDQMNPDPRALSDPVLRQDAIVSAKLNLRQVDRAPEDVLNRILWRAVKGTREPYPTWAITAVPDED
ncbi:MAG: bifunctional YncE family protein/alkaline phosphatase family protein [Verrucomicrobia bacterium]|nr:bifunctional YncE family protein/alkaline phosphatase family protein [Verrucomicrobiota bacterium]